MSDKCDVFYTFFITLRNGEKQLQRRSFPYSMTFCKENGFPEREGTETTHRTLANEFGRFLMLDKNTASVEIFAERLNGEQAYISTLNWG